MDHRRQSPASAHTPNSNTESLPDTDFYFRPPAPDTSAVSQQSGVDAPSSIYESNLTDTGPKQSRKPAMPQDEAPKPRFPGYGNAKALLNPRAAAGRSAADGSAKTDHADQDKATNMSAESNPTEQPGMSSLIERFHNVSKRDDVTPRKRKSEAREDDDDDDEDPERKKARSTFGGTAKGGMMSEHLKAEREKIASRSGPPSAIDLTNDQEDDDCQVVGGTSIDRGNEEICLGVIRTGKAHISRLPNYSRDAQAGVGKESWPRVKLQPRRQVASQDHKVELTDRSGMVCGTLDLKLAGAVCPLLDGRHQSKVRMIFYLDAHRRRDGQSPGAHVSQYLAVSVILYAPRNKKDSIGRFLSQRQAFLSSPTSVGVAVAKEIDNPHEPKLFGDSHRRPQSSHPMPAVMRSMEEMKRDAESMFDSLVKHEDIPEMEANSKLIVTDLMAHQKQALRFMSDHEKADHASAGEPGFSLWKAKVDAKRADVWYNVISGHESKQRPEPVRGGILADMMGLGKTLSILSLIASTKEEARVFGETEPEDDVPEVVRNSKATLIICPKSVMANWHEQIHTHTRAKTFRVYSYHGSSRMQDVDELAKYNIVLTTYNTAAAEFTMRGRALASIQWHRIVLDEAHQIRNQSTQVSKACCALVAQRRWAVTGTPVQNGLGDLGALIKFLRVKPFDEDKNWAQFIMAPFKNANADVIQHLRLLVDSITLRRMKDKIDLPGRFENIERLDWPAEERRIYEKVSGESSKKLMMMRNPQGMLKGKAYAHVLKSLLRMRMICSHGLDMFSDQDRMEIAEGMNPDNAIAIDLGDEPDNETYAFVTENDAYGMLHISSDSDTNRCQKCDRKIGEPENQDDVDLASDSDDDSSIASSGDEIIGYLTPCYHLLCTKCKDPYVATVKQNATDDDRHRCPFCDAFVRFGLFAYQKSTLKQFLEARSTKIKKRQGRAWDNSTYKGPSTKVQALVEDLKRSAAQSAQLPEGEPPIRSVVFSGWTNYLDLIEIALEDNEIGFVRLDGTMSVRARSNVLRTFATDPSVTVFLISIKAGGQGLNLISANKVYMMEPQFNPGVEQQAIDRVHRLGQKRDVHITHYIMKDSVENGILDLQKKKEDLARFTLERKLSKQEEAVKRIEELKSLFK